MSSRQIEVIAHRGLHDTATENTLAAFEAAVSAGADSFELDVHAAADGTVVVHHDASVGAKTAVNIAEVSAAEVLKAGQDAGLQIPTLEVVLKQFAGMAKVYIEVKAPNMELLVARLIRESSCEVAVHAFDHRVVKELRDFVPGVQTGVLTVSRPVDPAAVLRSAHANDYWPQIDFVDEVLVQDIHAAGGRVIAWTANTPEQWQRCMGAGVDGICTDRPDLLKKWIEAL